MRKGRIWLAAVLVLVAGACFFPLANGGIDGPEGVGGPAYVSFWPLGVPLALVGVGLLVSGLRRNPTE